MPTYNIYNTYNIHNIYNFYKTYNVSTPTTRLDKRAISGLILAATRICT
jgi:hypothetical protein